MFIYMFIYFKMFRSTKRFVFFRIYLFILFFHTCMFLALRFRQRTRMAQCLVFNETWTHSCLQFEWFSVGYGFFYEGHSFIFLECVSLSLFYPSFAFDIGYVVCVCVCIGVVSDFTYSYFFSMYVWMCVLRFFCIYIYIYIYTFASICVCVWFLFYLTLV